MIRILIADRDGLTRVGFRSIISDHPFCVCIDEAWTHEDLMNSIKDGRYDLLVIDPVSFGGTGEHLINHIKQIQGNINVLVFSSMDELAFGKRLIQAGAGGFLMKTCSHAELILAVSRVGVGKMFVSAGLAEQLASRSKIVEFRPSHLDLSEREFQVFAMLVCGKRNNEISNLLSVSVKTVSTHKARILVKLDLKNMSDVVQYAISQKLIAECEAIFTARLSCCVA